MKKEDFYNLKINQVIYVNGQKDKITYLCLACHENLEIGFLGSGIKNFEDVCECMSFSPPKPKKRYWLWDVKGMFGEIYRSTTYVDDKGNNTAGMSIISKDLFFRKLETEFIDIEE